MWGKRERFVELVREHVRSVELVIDAYLDRLACFDCAMTIPTKHIPDRGLANFVRAYTIFFASGEEEGLDPSLMYHIREYQHKNDSVPV
jgi:hypothetical protein